MGPLQPSHFWAKMWWCKVAKAKVRSCAGIGGKMRRQSTKVEKVKVWHYYRSFNFTLSPSQLRTFDFAFFYCIQQISFIYIEIDAAPYSPEVCWLYNLRCYSNACARGHCAYYECLLIFYCVRWHICLPMLTMPNQKHIILLIKCNAHHNVYICTTRLRTSPLPPLKILYY